MQYWDNRAAIPTDVQGCLDTWSQLDRLGFEHLLFDDTTALWFIQEHFDASTVNAFERCSHPAMRADYFRLCFILLRGGFYVDADDVFLGSDIAALFTDSRLKVQPLCYEIDSDSMVNPFLSADLAENDNDNRIFYINNNPLIAPPEHPIIRRALIRATEALLAADPNDRDIQSLTGPGNLTASLVEHVIVSGSNSRHLGFEFLQGWDEIAPSKWPLEYRSDERNWRNWTRGNHR